MRSMQARLAASLIAAVFALLGLQWLVVNTVIRHVIEDFVVSRLEHDAETLVSALDFDADGLPVLAGGLANGVYERPFSGHYYRIVVGATTVRSRSLWDEDLNLPPQTPGASITTHAEGPLRQPLLVYVSGYNKQGRDLSIAVAEDLTHLEHEIGAFRWLYAAVSMLALIALIVVQVLLVRRSLRPLERARRQLPQLERGTIARLDEDAPSEVRPLVQEVNSLVQMQAQRLQRSRNALGNLAHAVKAPLTLLTQLAESDELADRPELRRRIATHAATIRTLTERELKSARLAGGPVPGRQFEFDKEIPPLIDMLKSIYRDRGLDFRLDYPAGGTYAIDREDLLELLGNLLDNACKWARSKVALSLRPGRHLALVIEDDGPGVPPERLDELTRRGVRIDESIAGHGLGLAIVSDTVHHYGGQLHLGRSESLGGFKVEIVLPGV